MVRRHQSSQYHHDAVSTSQKDIGEMLSHSHCIEKKAEWKNVDDHH